LLLAGNRRFGLPQMFGGEVRPINMPFSFSQYLQSPVSHLLCGIGKSAFLSPNSAMGRKAGASRPALRVLQFGNPREGGDAVRKRIFWLALH
jgi:hypothetical protein